MKNLLVSFLAVATLLLTGCGTANPVTTFTVADVHEKIKPGMTRQEVRSLLGEPKRIQRNKDRTVETYAIIKERNVAGCTAAAVAAPVTLGLSVLMCSSTPRAATVVFNGNVVSDFSTN